MDNSKRKTIAHTLIQLEESISGDDLSIFFFHLRKLQEMTGEAYANRVLIAFAQECPEAPLVRDYIIPRVLNMQDIKPPEEADRNG